MRVRVTVGVVVRDGEVVGVSDGLGVARVRVLVTLGVAVVVEVGVVFSSRKKTSLPSATATW